MCHNGIANLQDDIQAAQGQPPANNVVCEMCSRKFRGESNKKRHKCLVEGQKPVNEQKGTVQCQVCLRWFKSKGGLAVHRCNLLAGT